MSLCQYDDSPWCPQGTCKDCDEGWRAARRRGLNSDIFNPDKQPHEPESVEVIANEILRHPLFKEWRFFQTRDGYVYANGGYVRQAHLDRVKSYYVDDVAVVYRCSPVPDVYIRFRVLKSD